MQWGLLNLFGFRKRARSLLRAELERMLVLTDDRGHPNLGALRLIANAIDPMSLSIKQYGYALARQLAAALPPGGDTVAEKIGVRNSLATQQAIESDWARHWCNELGIAVVYHRKIWELCFVMQALYDADMIRPGLRGLGFGCGGEPLPSYFAAHGLSITATDLSPDEAAGQGWISSRTLWTRCGRAESACTPPNSASKVSAARSTIGRTCCFRPAISTG